MTTEASRRHGHSDPRYVARPRLYLVRNGDSQSDEVAEALDDGDGVGAWEDEGGLYAMADLPVEETTPDLDWDAYGKQFFPGRRRHDFNAVKAYEAYRDTGLVPAAAAALPQV